LKVGNVQVIAVAIAIGIAFHAGAHLICDFPRLLHTSKEEYEAMKPFFGSDKPSNYWWFLKGIEGMTGIAMVVLMVVAFTLATPLFRRNKVKLPRPLQRITGFNAFWYSHHLFMIVYTLLIIHGIFLYLTHKWYKKTVNKKLLYTNALGIDIPWLFLKFSLHLFNMMYLVSTVLAKLLNDSCLPDMDVPGSSCIIIWRRTNTESFQIRLKTRANTQGLLLHLFFIFVILALHLQSLM
jgi:hypothetical protein